MSNEPWLNPGRFKSDYEQNWATQFEKAEEVFLVVPTSLVEDAKRVLKPIQEEMQLPYESFFGNSPLFIFSRLFKPSSPEPSRLLLEARIPHVKVRYRTARFPDRMKNMRAYECDFYYWQRDYDFVQHQNGIIQTQQSIKDSLQSLEGFILQLQWDRIVEFGLEIKTLALIKGNDDGLPKTYEQGQNWSAK